MNWLFPVLIAAIPFGLGLILCDLPFLADDHFYLWRGLTVPNLGWTDSYTFARMPVSTLLSQGVIKWGILERHPSAFVFALFITHALAVSLLCRAFFKKLNLKIIQANQWLCILIVAIFSLQPNNYEIHLWHFCALHSLGALAVACAFSLQSRIASIALLSLATLTYDSFFLMTLGAAALWFWANPKRSEAMRVASLFIGSFAIGIIAKLVLKTVVGSLQVIPIEFSPYKILVNTAFVMREMFLIHFYKVNWPLTIAHLIALLSTVLLSFQSQIFSRRKLWVLIFIPFVCALPLALNSNPAPRSYYGPQLIQVLVLVTLLAKLSLQMKFTRVLVAAFAITFGVQWFLVFSLKDENAKKMKLNEKGVIAQMRDCQSPCQLRVPNPEEGLKRDFILPQCHWANYYDRLRIKNFPEKQISFEIIENPNN